jgi:hypothetical protein
LELPPDDSDDDACEDCGIPSAPFEHAPAAEADPSAPGEHAPAAEEDLGIIDAARLADVFKRLDGEFDGSSYTPVTVDPFLVLPSDGLGVQACRHCAAQPLAAR